MADVIWPCGLLKYQNVSFDIDARSVSGPSTVHGRGQVVSADAGIWKATLGNVIIRTKEHVLTWRAIQTRLQGRLGTVLISRCGAYQPSSSLLDDPTLTASEAQALREELTRVPFSDDAPFGDGSLFEQSIASGAASTVMAAGAVSADITMPQGMTIQAGQDFSIGERMYRLFNVQDNGSQQYSIQFLPPLREEVPLGSNIEFGEPKIRMRLQTDDEMDLTLENHVRSFPTVNLVEDL